MQQFKSRKLRNKLRSKKGETLVEILIAILVVAFGCMIVAIMFTSSMNLNFFAAKKDKEFYQAMSDIEQLTQSEEQTTKTGTVEIKGDEDDSTTVDVNVYGDDSNVAYKGK